MLSIAHRVKGTNGAAEDARETFDSSGFIVVRRMRTSLSSTNYKGE